jgi:hypothetical protein
MMFLTVMDEKKDYIELGQGLAIYKLKQSKNWYIYLWDKENKEPIRRSLKISDRTKAEHEARFLQMAQERDLEGSILSKPSKLVKSVVKKLIDELEKERDKLKVSYKNNKSKNKRNLSSDNKYKEFGRTINIYNSFSEKLANINVKELDYVHLKAFYNEYNGKVSKTQIRYMNLAVNKILDYCLTKRLINNVPQIPKIKSKISETNKYFTQTDYDTIINKLINKKPRKKVEKENNQLLLQAFKFLTETGIRPGNELVNIQCSDLSVEKIQNRKYWILQIKGGKRAEKDGVKRKIVISEKAMYSIKWILKHHFSHNIVQIESTLEHVFVSELKKHKDRYLFARRDGHTPDYTTIFGNLRDEITDDLVEKKLVMYSCRHTFITNQLKRDANINVVAKHCGTSTDMINKHYNHLLSMMKPNELLEDIYSVDDEIKHITITEDMMRRSGVNSEEEYMENLTWMCENEPPEPDTEWIKNKIELLDQ